MTQSHIYELPITRLYVKYADVEDGRHVKRHIKNTIKHLK
ncbi:Uncharacterized protein BM_BM452 [Brugia malayi]|uniref:Bm452 n=1 Tax=Brugia malayi TaxID=6279 RepID=A0A0J9XTZ9_BRUMA|nr:Uncharacterized protein BM_BM452 [Brugia malayi]CDP95681.1 Bm452 [Brugia malayi]VIO97628.1 Uncharacterized protein BM_BM452 [Brugia malayi]